MVRIQLWGVFIVFAFLASACSDDSSGNPFAQKGRCKSKYGCLNEDFIQYIEANCENMENGCRTSFDQIFGEVDQVYFADMLNVWFDECNTMPISDMLKETATEMCRYAFLERDGKIVDYLRCWCLSDVNISRNERIDFDAHLVGMVSTMNGSEKVNISRTAQGKRIYYHIALDESTLSEYNGDKCIHSP